MTLSEKSRQLLEDFEPITDPMERMTLVVDSGKQSKTLLPENQRIEENRIRGCVSSAWISCEVRDGLCHFRCAADSPLVQGLLACLCFFFSDVSPAEVASSNEDPLTALGLTRNLSPTRQNGLRNARERILQLAGALGSP